MVVNIDELRERLQDPDATFTSEEVQTLIDWTVARELQNDYQTQRVASALQQSVLVTEYANSAMDRMIALWDSAPMTPTLEVVTDGEA